MDKGSNDTAEKYLAKKNNDSTAKVLNTFFCDPRLLSKDQIKWHCTARLDRKWVLFYYLSAVQ